ELVGERRHARSRRKFGGVPGSSWSSVGARRNTSRRLTPTADLSASHNDASSGLVPWRCTHQVTRVANGVPGAENVPSAPSDHRGGVADAGSRWIQVPTNASGQYGRARG